MESKYGVDSYLVVLGHAGLENQYYMAVGTYDDTEFTALIKATAAITGRPAQAILEDFGEFITPDLIDMYRSLVDPEWRTADFLMYAEERVHPVVRMRNPGTRPPVLKFQRLGQNELHFHYDSPRQMSAVAKGIMKGVARHYGDTLQIEEHHNEDGSIDMHILVL